MVFFVLFCFFDDLKMCEKRTNEGKNGLNGRARGLLFISALDELGKNWLCILFVGEILWNTNGFYGSCFVHATVCYMCVYVNILNHSTGRAVAAAATVVLALLFSLYPS